MNQSRLAEGWGGSPQGGGPCVLAGGRLENLAVNGLNYITVRKSHITLHYSQKKSDYITLQARKVTLHYITGTAVTR